MGIRIYSGLVALTLSLGTLSCGDESGGVSHCTDSDGKPGCDEWKVCEAECSGNPCDTSRECTYECVEPDTSISYIRGSSDLNNYCLNN